VVQELEIRPRVIRYRRERWLTPDGRTVVAPLPSGISGHFGPNLRRFVLAQCHQGQVTVPRLMAQLRDFGLAVSKRQVVRLLTAKQEPFLNEAREVLRAGLKSATWLTAEDTGARHKACPGEGRGHRTASARRSVMTASSGSARPRPRAGAIFSNYCALGMRIMRSTPRRSLICAAARWPARSSSAWPSIPTSTSPITPPGRRTSIGSASRR
jgi:hypothetical protein